MRKKLFTVTYIAFLAALLGMIGFISCKSHQTKYGPPPTDYNQQSPQTKYGVPVE